MRESGKMKRRMILAVVTIALLALFGGLLHSAPVDAISGATPRARREAQEAQKLEGNYIFCINAEDSKFGITDSALRKKLINFVSGKTDTLDVEKKENFYLYVPETDYALVRYAKRLCSSFEKNGDRIKLREYSSTMLYSRVAAGKYQMFLASEDSFDAQTRGESDFTVLKSSEMEQEEA